MLRVIIIASTLVITGLVIGLNIDTAPQPVFAELETLRSPAAVNTSPVDHQQTQRLDALEQKLIEESQSRKELSNQIADLKTLIQQLQQKNVQLTNAQTIEEPLALATESSVSTSQESANLPQIRTTEEILVAIGLDESIATQLKKREEAREMDMLYLRNKATREGWFGTEKYFEESRKLDNQNNVYRQELGDQTYDRYLYESDQFNRVKVSSVISSSPAANAGIEEGDIIFRYDNQRVFSWNELTTLTTTGEVGQSVNVEIIRNNQVVNLALPRGPMGIRLSGAKINPDKS